MRVFLIQFLTNQHDNSYQPPQAPRPARTCMGSSGGVPVPKGFVGEAVSGLGAKLPSASFCGRGTATTLAARRVCAAGAQSAGLLGLVRQALSRLGAKLLSAGLV